MGAAGSCHVRPERRCTVRWPACEPHRLPVAAALLAWRVVVVGSLRDRNDHGLAIARRRRAASSRRSTGQTETEWGVIWDAIPADFPVYSGAVTSEESATVPSRANLVVDGPDPSAVARPGPTRRCRTRASRHRRARPSMEDGSMSIDAVRGTDCRVLVTSAPLGSLTSITILYGASCPQP